MCLCRSDEAMKAHRTKFYKQAAPTELKTLIVSKSLMLRDALSVSLLDWFYAPEARWMIAGGETTGRVNGTFRVPAGTPDLN